MISSKILTSKVFYAWTPVPTSASLRNGLKARGKVTRFLRKANPTAGFATEIFAMIFYRFYSPKARNISSSRAPL